MPDATRRWTLADIPAEHRDFVARAAAEEDVTVHAWMERTIAEKVIRAGGGEGRATRTAREDEIADLGEGAERGRRRRAATHQSAGRERRAHDRVEEERETEVEETTQTTRETVGERARRGARREGGEFASGISDYHSRIAAREAAAEGVPVPIWLEQVIFERSRRESREPARTHLGPAAPPPPAATPVVAETVVRGRGGDLPALLLGAVLAILLILLLSWFRWGPSLFFADGQHGDHGACCNAPSPATPTNGSSAGPGVIVTTLVDGAAQAAAPRSPTPTPHPARPIRFPPSRHHWRRPWGDRGRGDRYEDQPLGWGGRYGLDCGCNDHEVRARGISFDESEVRPD